MRGTPSEGDAHPFMDPNVDTPSPGRGRGFLRARLEAYRHGAIALTQIHSAIAVAKLHYVLDIEIVAMLQCSGLAWDHVTGVIDARCM